jgi:hypothetical protein
MYTDFLFKHYIDIQFINITLHYIFILNNISFINGVDISKKNYRNCITKYNEIGLHNSIKKIII